MKRSVERKVDYSLLNSRLQNVYRIFQSFKDPSAIGIFFIWCDVSVMYLSDVCDALTIKKKHTDVFQNVFFLIFQVKQLRIDI
jgi:hypothetical protein